MSPSDDRDHPRGDHPREDETRPERGGAGRERSDSAPWETYDPDGYDRLSRERGRGRAERDHYDREAYDERGRERGGADRDTVPTGQAGPRRTKPIPGRDERTRPTHKPTQLPRKLTVTRVALYRARLLSSVGLGRLRTAAHADGAGESGLSSLTYAVMLGLAADAALAVALANALFFSAGVDESRTRAGLYLLVAAVPFALLAPLLGPALDHLRRGRRWALAGSCALRVAAAVVLALHFDGWALYPAALVSVLLSRSFTALREAITPEVLPPEVERARADARLTAFGLVAGVVSGLAAIGLVNTFGPPGALWLSAALCVANTWCCLRVPARAEVAEGGTPGARGQGAAGRDAKGPDAKGPDAKGQDAKGRERGRRALGRAVVAALWANGSIRVLAGFLVLFAAFLVRAEVEYDPVQQLLLLGVVVAAAVAGGLLGGVVGARLPAGSPDRVLIGCVGAALASALLAAALPGLTTVAVVGLVGAAAGTLAKATLDAVARDELPERSPALVRPEALLRLGWVFGGALGVLLPTEQWIGFAVVSLLLALGLAQVVLTWRGRSLLPRIGGDRQAGAGAADG
ncbi:MFS transporter [Actinosynnema mirum]|uniref:Major facilitator superfamily MFS_1 n=1 Tax=Actinosynnema mirum (strain ATCC 29888 / DSM 43827 / JCM 3225 / NBRC 14064 / NCIMB 13271 / NRRL B-12336 / IMRU 3971 / 101) TaxID=446462 RepID=C6WHZ9_ACTMD|nr:MFS transporter [Actinosynnema mirum]ACU34450.1 major facilitator superfamily MFS_1 [Actinosynnema mirum DSM 43827]